jgi:uncharacterized membrane protein YjjP (DUF1212 family)
VISTLISQVMVWIPKHALFSGMASIFDGSIVAATENVVMVTIQILPGCPGLV